MTNRLTNVWAPDPERILEVDVCGVPVEAAVCRIAMTLPGWKTDLSAEDGARVKRLKGAWAGRVMPSFIVVADRRGELRDGAPFATWRRGRAADIEEIEDDWANLDTMEPDVGQSMFGRIAQVEARLVLFSPLELWEFEGCVWQARQLERVGYATFELSYSGGGKRLQVTPTLTGMTRTKWPNGFDRGDPDNDGEPIDAFRHLDCPVDGHGLPKPGTTTAELRPLEAALIARWKVAMPEDWKRRVAELTTAANSDAVRKF